MEYFIEKQYLIKNPLIWIVLIGLIPILIIILFFETDTDNRMLLVLSGLVPTLIMFLGLSFINLRTRITHEGIFARLVPLHFKEKLIPYSDIESISIRKYSALGEFGGWGIRIGFGKNGKTKKAYNISGNMGIDIKLKNGKSLLIGTQKPNEAEIAISKIKSKILVN